MRGTDMAAKGGRRLMELLEKYKFVLLVLLAGILLLLLPTFEGGDGTGGSGRTDPPSELAFDLEGLEKKLSDTLSEVEGAGEVSVVLTVKASTRQVLAQDITSSQKEGADHRSGLQGFRQGGGCAASADISAVSRRSGGLPRGKRPGGTAQASGGGLCPDRPGKR